MKKLNKSLSLLMLLLIFACSNDTKDNKGNLNIEPSNNVVNQKNPNAHSPEGNDYDACDCNRRSQMILDKTIALRLKFDSINSLKNNQNSKLEVKNFAKEYVELVKKCFEINNARLLVDSECNNLRVLQAKKDSLLKLGIQIDLGGAIKL